LIDADSEILFSRKRPEHIIAFTIDGLMHEFEVSAIRDRHGRKSHERVESGFDSN
jgi:hypothetical protein